MSACANDGSQTSAEDGWFRTTHWSVVLELAGVTRRKRMPHSPDCARSIGLRSIATFGA